MQNKCGNNFHREGVYKPSVSQHGKHQEGKERKHRCTLILAALFGAYLNTENADKIKQE